MPKYYGQDCESVQNKVHSANEGNIWHNTSDIIIIYEYNLSESMDIDISLKEIYIYSEEFFPVLWMKWKIKFQTLIKYFKVI